MGEYCHCSMGSGDTHRPGCKSIQAAKLTQDRWEMERCVRGGCLGMGGRLLRYGRMLMLQHKASCMGVSSLMCSLMYGMSCAASCM